MKYKLSDKQELDSAWDYLNKLTGQEAIVEIKKVNPKRSLKQNSYYHLLLGIFGYETGFTIEEAKEIHKRDISPGIFAYKKKNGRFYKSSANLTSKELSDSIEQLKRKATEVGVYLPDANEYEKLRYYSNYLEAQGGSYI